MLRLRILFEGWRMVQHSYGQVLAFTLIHMYKLYGPNGKLGHKIDFYVTEAEYFRPEWNKTKQLVYDEEYNTILRSLPEYNGEDVDLIYRQTYPYNINVSDKNCQVPKCVFYTSEYSKLDSTFFQLVKPVELSIEKHNNYISSFLQKFSNIYFISPSNWSSRGMTRYLTDHDYCVRNRTITHGVDTKVFFRHDNTITRNELRHNFNVKDDEILLINIGGAMTSNKGIPIILHALHVLVNLMGHTHYKLMLKGSGDLYPSTQILQRYFDSFQRENIMTPSNINALLDHIIFTNETLSYSQINDLYNAADVYVSPYLAEGFGLTMLEALASGLHVLVPTTGSTKEYIDDIFENGGGYEFITFVYSNVVQDNDGNYKNDIKLHDVVNTLLVNETKFKTPKSVDMYIQMKSYIETEYSWYKVSTLLYEYFLEIHSTFHEGSQRTP
jgi:glycosyltransferase involved in cell wall biosynthesis